MQLVITSYNIISKTNITTSNTGISEVKYKKLILTIEVK